MNATAHKRGLLVLIPLTFLIVALAGSASARGSVGLAAAPCISEARTLASVGGPQSYDDVVEETAGPDICSSNIVTNDNEAITIAIHMHNRNGYLAADTYSVYLDTDRTAATGPNGADYVVGVSVGRGTLLRFNGATFEPTAARVRVSWVEGYGPVMQFAKQDLATEAFDFYLEAGDGHAIDRAPEAGSWSYQLRPLSLVARGTSLSPAKAGNVFVASTRIVRSDWNAELEEGRIACTATLGAARLVGHGRFTHGRVACSWRLPRNAGGRLLAGRVAAAFQGVVASRSFRVRVRRGSRQ